MQGPAAILRQMNVRNLESDRLDSLQLGLHCLKKYVIPNCSQFPITFVIFFISVRGYSGHFLKKGF